MHDQDAVARRAPFGWLCAGLPAAFAAAQEAQRRNVDALWAANHAAMAGYRSAYARLFERCTASAAETRDRIEAMHGQRLDAASAAAHVAAAQAAVEGAMADMQLLAEMTGTATADAFAILRARTEEAIAEFRTANARLV